MGRAGGDTTDSPLLGPAAARRERVARIDDATEDEEMSEENVEGSRRCSECGTEYRVSDFLRDCADYFGPPHWYSRGSAE